MNIWQAMVKLVEALDRHRRPNYVLGALTIVGIIFIAATLAPVLLAIAFRQLLN